MKVSVCMAVYNGENFIREQIDSILPQLKESDEIIISDDGSTDQTLSVINSYKDDRISVYHSGRKNIVMNFENALKRAKGDIIFLADQDDIWYPNKVENMVKWLQDFDLVFSNASVFNDTIEETSLLYNKGKNRTGLCRNLIKNNFIGATMAFNRKILDKALPFPENIYMHDAWIGSIAEITGKTNYLEDALIYYRRHGGNASQTGEKSSNSFLKKVSIRFNLVLSLLKRVL